MYAYMTILALLVIIPLLHVLLSAFKTSAEIARVQILPSAFRFDNFRTVLANPDTVFSFVNTVSIAAFAISIAIAVSSIAAYGIARRKEKFFSILLFVFLSSMIIPPVSTLVVIYGMVLNLGLMDTRASLVILYAAGMIPFAVLIYSGFIKSVPRSLDEAAMMEGCGYFSRFYRIVFPIVRPVTATVVLLRMPAIWNDFLLPLLFLRSPEKKTITLMVYAFTWEHNQDFGAIFALLVMAVLPPLVFFLVGQRSIYSAIAKGAVKA